MLGGPNRAKTTPFSFFDFTHPEKKKIFFTKFSTAREGGGERSWIVVDPQANPHSVSNYRRQAASRMGGFMKGLGPMAPKNVLLVNVSPKQNYI